MKVTNDLILTYYMRGFNDELSGNYNKDFRTEAEDSILETAYHVGSCDAIVGDDVFSSDGKTNNEIIDFIQKIHVVKN
jgi:hypothetical protein